MKAVLCAVLVVLAAATAAGQDIRNYTTADMYAAQICADDGTPNWENHWIADCPQGYNGLRNFARAMGLLPGSNPAPKAPGGVWRLMRNWPWCNPCKDSQRCFEFKPGVAKCIVDAAANRTFLAEGEVCLDFSNGNKKWEPKSVNPVLFSKTCEWPLFSCNWDAKSNNGVYRCASDRRAWRRGAQVLAGDKAIRASPGQWCHRPTHCAPHPSCFVPAGVSASAPRPHPSQSGSATGLPAAAGGAALTSGMPGTTASLCPAAVRGLAPRLRACRPCQRALKPTPQHTCMCARTHAWSTSVPQPELTLCDRSPSCPSPPVCRPQPRLQALHAVPIVCQRCAMDMGAVSWLGGAGVHVSRSCLRWKSRLQAMDKCHATPPPPPCAPRVATHAQLRPSDNNTAQAWLWVWMPAAAPFTHFGFATSTCSAAVHPEKTAAIRRLCACMSSSTNA